MRIAHLLGIGMLAAVMMAGCTSEMTEQNALLMEENEDLRMQLRDRDSALESAVATARERDREASELRRQLRDAQRTPTQPDARTGFEGIAGVTGTRSPGEVTATIESDILFDSGSAKLKPQAKQALNQVAGVLTSTHAGREIRIVGHTDTDPIRLSGFTSNHHLGFERAYSVREYLAERGVSATRMHIASYGPDRPRETKAKSRRVEIVVLVD